MSISQEKTVSIVRAFAKAAMEKPEDPAFDDRMMRALPVPNMTMLELAASLITMKQKLGDKSDTDPKYIDTAIKLADIIAKDYFKFCTPEEIKALVPAEARDREVIKSFESRDAKNLVKAFKL